MDESPKDLAKEADRGRSERTPAIALAGVTLVVGAVVVVLAGIVLIVYFAFK